LVLASCCSKSQRSPCPQQATSSAATLLSRWKRTQTKGWMDEWMERGMNQTSCRVQTPLCEIGLSVHAKNAQVSIASVRACPSLSGWMATASRGSGRRGQSRTRSFLSSASQHLHHTLSHRPCPQNLVCDLPFLFDPGLNCSASSTRECDGLWVPSPLRLLCLTLHAKVIAIFALARTT
jgi:hypothetical protein